MLSSPPSLNIRHFAPQTKNYITPLCNVAPPATPVPQRIAVIGGGLAGLSVIYHILHSTARYAQKRQFDNSTIQITLFDPVHPGTGGASAAAAGLLHQFRPRPKKKLWNHQKGIDAALHLLTEAETCGQKLVSTPGILKLAFNKRTVEDFQVAAGRFPKELEYLDVDNMVERFPELQSKVPGLIIRQGHVVDTASYMKALWQICQGSGRVSWSQRSISSISELFDDSEFKQSFDNVVFCAGAAVKQFTDLKHVPISRCLGHNLVMESDQSTLPMPLMSGSYVVPQYTSNSKACKIIVGATHQYGFDDGDFDISNKEKLEGVKDELSGPLQKLLPQLFDEWNISGIQTGIRAVPPRNLEGAIPIVCQVKGAPEDRFCWLFTGLGGRGLMYHAFLGRKLAHAIIAGREHHIPGDARRLEIRLQ